MVSPVQSRVPSPIEASGRSIRTGVLQRKCACGGSAGLTGECEECKSNKLLGKPLQAKLWINEPGDQYEQEADRVAEQVMRMPASPRKGEPLDRVVPLVQRHATGGNTGVTEAPPIVHDVLSSPGQPLDTATRAFFEPRFGHDFSQVRVHAGEQAEQSARDVNAHAYTVGHNIVFGTGRFALGTHEGRRLLAHELTHVSQQLNISQPCRARSSVLLARSVVSSDRMQRKTAGTPGVCDPSNLGTLGPAFAKSAEDVKKLNLPSKLLRTVRLSGEKDFVLYCPHQASLQIGNLSPGTTAYFVGRGKVKSKDEVWAKLEGHDRWYWGFIANDKYEHVESVEVPEAKITVDRPVPKRGVCGPNVTKQLANGVENVRKDFSVKTDDQKDEMCDQIDSLIHGPVTWDFPRLHVRGWMKGIRDTCATVVKDDQEPCCANSVQVNEECFYAGSANYVLFGVICKACFDHYLNRKRVDLSGVYRFNSNRMLKLIEAYKADAWNFSKSKDWSLAGYKGWPKGSSTPSGDCSKDCSLTCPLPFFIKGGADNEAFRGRWCPHIDPLGACKSGPANVWDYGTRAKQ